ncbi:MAG: hypothetical protein HOB79_17570 [Rhodospirillaceae bacterium]|nr:hypothetical protein [Rhodospirillaceae bacterium]
MQILAQATNAVGSLNQDKIAEHMHKTTYKTVVGDVKFGSNGEWAKTRVLQVQFRNVEKSNMAQFTKPGKRIVLYPDSVKSGSIIYPYRK